MTLQARSVVLVASGFASEPGLRDGVHLRWQVNPSRGFPPLGFDLYRRTHRPGTPRLLDFSQEAPRSLSQSFSFGSTRWSTADYAPRIASINAGGASVSALQPIRSALTCRFDPAEGLVRRVELDIVHWRVSGSQPAVAFSLWGVAGDERVATGTVLLDGANSGQIVTVAVKGDALDGIQVWADRFSIVRVRWVLVADEAEIGWTQPLNPRRIGFSVTAPGYLVRHAHWPDQGHGAQDWQEAADRLAMNAGAPLPAEILARFGLPGFDALRALMRADVLRPP